MIASWIFEDNAKPFLTALGWIVGYDVDDQDWTAVYFGTRDTDIEQARWFEYTLHGSSPALVRLARDPGSSVIHIEVHGVEPHEPEIEIAIEIFARYHIRDAHFGAAAAWDE